MNGMFQGCSSLTSLDVSNFDTSSVTSMILMFQGCSGLNSINVSSFDTSNVTNMYGMFNSCKGLTTIDLSNFNTGKVTSMGSMFSGCLHLQTFKLYGWDTAKVESMNNMFALCYALQAVYMNGVLSSVDMTKMFYDCKALILVVMYSSAVISPSSCDDMFTNVTTNGDLYINGNTNPPETMLIEALPETWSYSTCPTQPTIKPVTPPPTDET
jgi:surface protein